MSPEAELLAHLDAGGIAYERHVHPAVFTCEQAAELGLDIAGADTKNLFLADKDETRHFLLVTTHDKRVDLKELAKALSLPKLGFGSAEKLKDYLGVEPGSVTILGLLHDSARHVKLLVDEDVWGHDFIQCHPLVNTATLVIARAGLETFLHNLDCAFAVVPVPARGASPSPGQI